MFLGEAAHSIQLPYVDSFRKIGRIVKQGYKTTTAIFNDTCPCVSSPNLYYLASNSLPATKSDTLDWQHKQPLSILLLVTARMHTPVNNLAISYLCHLNSWVSSICPQNFIKNLLYTA